MLLRSIGFEIPAAHVGDTDGGPCFFTNAVLCLKQGGMQAKVRQEWFANCGSRFLRPTIDLIAPRVVVTLGERAYRAVSSVYGAPPTVFRKAVDRSHGFRLSDGIICVPVYHCAARVVNKDRKMSQQIRDWERVRRALDDWA
jgi:uracil-DNA glycosylase family 4